MRLVASCGYLVVICYVGSKIVGFGFGNSLGMIWDLLIWFGLVFQWCFKGGGGVWLDCVKTYVMYIGDKTHFTCNLVDLGWV